MIAFKLLLNSGSVACAGATDLAVMTLFIDAGINYDSSQSDQAIASYSEILFSLQGLTHGGANAEWIPTQGLNVGDELTLEIIDISDPETPSINLERDSLQVTPQLLKSILAFEVTLNSKILFNAGRNDMSVLSLRANLVNRRRSAKDSSMQSSLSFDLTGLGRDSTGHPERLIWAESSPLAVGDVLAVKILDAETTSTPMRIDRD